MGSAFRGPPPCATSPTRSPGATSPRPANTWRSFGGSSRIRPRGDARESRAGLPHPQPVAVRVVDAELGHSVERLLQLRDLDPVLAHSWAPASAHPARDD